MPPASVTAAGDAYRGDMDLLGPWLEEKCVIGSNQSAAASTLWASYSTWSMCNPGRSLTQRKFADQMADRFKKVRGRSGYTYQGVGLATEQPAPA